MAPGRDAVRLVDHEQAEARQQHVEHRRREARVGEPLGRHQQHVDLPGHEGALDLGPVVEVAGVEGCRGEPGPLRGGDLVAHQRQQGRHHEHRATAGVADGAGGDPVDRRLAPARRLHDESTAALQHEGSDRGALVVAHDRLGTGEGGDDPRGCGVEGRRRHDGHGAAPSSPSTRVARAAPRLLDLCVDRSSLGVEVLVAPDLDHERGHPQVAPVVAERHVGAGEGLVDDRPPPRERVDRHASQRFRRVLLVEAEAHGRTLGFRVTLVGQDVPRVGVHVEDHGSAMGLEPSGHEVCERQGVRLEVAREEVRAMDGVGFPQPTQGRGGRVDRPHADVVHLLSTRLGEPLGVHDQA